MHTTETTIFLSMLDNPEYAHLYEEFGKPIKLEEQPTKETAPAKRRATVRATTPRTSTVKPAPKPLTRTKQTTTKTAPVKPAQQQLEGKPSDSGTTEKKEHDTPANVN